MLVVIMVQLIYSEQFLAQLDINKVEIFIIIENVSYNAKLFAWLRIIDHLYSTSEILI